MPVSMTMAVVSTRVDPGRLPPTMTLAPTSEMMLPNAAMYAARSSKADSRAKSQSICHRGAPSACIWSPSLGLSCCTAATVRLIMMGQLRMNCTMTMAVGVNRKLRKPSGPCRRSRIDRMSPTTTGGRPYPTLQVVRSAVRPRKGVSAIQIPIGTPTSTLGTVALSEMRSDCRITLQVSGSPVTRSTNAPRRPSPRSFQYCHAAAGICHPLLQEVLFLLVSRRDEYGPSILLLAELADHLLAVRRGEEIRKCLTTLAVDFRKL